MGRSTKEKGMTHRLPTLASIPESGREPMTEEMSKGFIALVFSGIASGDPTFPISTLPEELAKRFGDDYLTAFAPEVMLGRLKYTGGDLKYSPLVVGFLSAIARNVAEVVMWAYFLTEETRNNGPVTVTKLADMFPLGFPTEEAVHEYWDAQKANPAIPSIFEWNSDNKLDSPDAWRVKEEV